MMKSISNSDDTLDSLIPEYRVGISLSEKRAEKNNPDVYCDLEHVEDIVRDAIQQGVSCEVNNSAPLKTIISPGMTFLVKPNWVFHENQSSGSLDCLVTHPHVLLAVIKEIVKTSPAKIIIGDAPIQGCDFSRLVTADLHRKIASITNCPFEVIDFRRTILEDDGKKQANEVRQIDRYVLFDLERYSLLEPVSSQDGNFRVTCYDPDILQKRHRPGRHQYLVCREIVEADVIINLPKLKTHRKAGITGALKNLVGINGNKEFLPHHRIGGSDVGGDCYPGKAPLKRIAEYCYDEANRSFGLPRRSKWLSRAYTLLNLQRRIGSPEIEGGWHGNDTVWRMVLDLNRLLLYGTADGTLADRKIRTCFTITDALVAGEGEGPLAPTPLALGAVTFSASSAFADLAHTALLRFDYRKISLVREAFGRFSYPLTRFSPKDIEAVVNGKILTLDELSTLGLDCLPPKGWIGNVELTERRKG